MEGKAWHDGKARQNGKMLFMCSETIKFCFCLICIHHLSFLFIFLYVHTCVGQKHGVPYWKINAKVLIILDSSCIIIMDLYKESFTIWFEYCNNLSQNSPDSGLFSRNSLEYISCQTYIFLAEIHGTFFIRLLFGIGHTIHSQCYLWTDKLL